MDIKFTVVFLIATGDIIQVESGKTILEGVNPDYDYLWTSEKIATVSLSEYGLEQVSNITVSNISEISDQQVPS